MPELRWFGRSPLSRYLVKHFDELDTEIRQYPRPPWTAVANHVAKAGVVDAKGKPPSANAVRDAFLRVRVLMEGQPKRLPKPEKPRLPRSDTGHPAVLPPNQDQPEDEFQLTVTKR